MSSILTPNTYLLFGQNDTIARFKSKMHEFLPDPAHIKLNPGTLAAAAYADRPAETHSRPGRGDDGHDARRIAAALPSCAVARHRRAELR